MTTRKMAMIKGLISAIGSAGWSICLGLLVWVSLSPNAGGTVCNGCANLSVSPSTFWAHSLDPTQTTVTISGTKFPAFSAIVVWLDTNDDGFFDASESSLISVGGGVAVLTDGAGGFGPTDFHFAGGVPAGAYSIRAGVCATAKQCQGLGDICKVTKCTPVAGIAAAAVTVMMAASPYRFGSGSTVTITGYGFAASTNLKIWYDTDPNGQLSADKTSISVPTDGNGAFTTPVVVSSAPTLDALWAALTNKQGVAALGPFYIHAGPSTTPAASAAVEIGTCWFQDCFITKPDLTVADTICLFGNSPGDFSTYFSDCKQVDSDYTDRGSYDLGTPPTPAAAGPEFLGAAVLAAAVNDLQPTPPFSACAAMTAAIVNAETSGNSVPDKADLLLIDCGAFLVPTTDLGAYILFHEACVNGVGPCEHVPDKALIGAAVAAIDAAAVAAGGAVAAASAGALAVAPLVNAIVQAAVPAALATGVDPGTASALGASIGPAMSGTIATLGFVGGAAAPLVTPAILTAAQGVLAEAAVAGAIACGHVDYHCYGSDITKTILTNADLQTKKIPITFLQPPFKAPPNPNACGAFTNGTCWGDIIGWAKVVCTNLDDSGSCEQPDGQGNYPHLAVPGSAGDSNIASLDNSGPPVNAPVCVTGKVLGISIGYDADVSFDLGEDPGIAPLLNYHNFLPGPGGSPAPGGIDIEIPLSDRGKFLDTITQIHPGVRVHVCGHWVADMHMLWNELHPITSLSIVADSTPPTTTASVNGSAGANGWYTAAVLVTLTATDPDSTVGSTTYALDGGSDSSYSNPFSVSGDAIHQLFFFSTDPAGNQETPNPLTIKIDGTAPAIQCGAPDGRWHAADVSIACGSSDAVSGLANPSDANFSLATVVAAGTETANASTGSHYVCDVAGNCAGAGPIAGNMIDKKPPSINIVIPNGGTYLLNQIVAASYSCSDAGSEVATCAGPVASGGNIADASVGTDSFTVNASDNVGNSSSATTNYTVAYRICPLYTVTSKQSGSTYPIKLQLCDAIGNNISSGAIVVHANGVVLASTGASAPLADSGNSNPDTDFRYDATLPGYIFNLSLAGYGSGTYLLQFTAGNDPTTHTAQFQVK